jgi:hypothetical protein
MRDRHVSLALIKSLKQDNFKGKVALSATYQTDADYYKKQGADKVLIPYQDAAAEAVRRLLEDEKNADNSIEPLLVQDTKAGQ